MGFRFRRSVKLLPGVRLNFSTRGVSTSIGPRGAALNISRRGTQATMGPPGKGLSYSILLSGPTRRGQAQPAPSTSAGATITGWIVIVLILLMIGSCLFGGTTPPPATVTAEPPAPTAEQTRTVAAKNVNCRAAPVDGAIRAQLDHGLTVSTLEQSNGWTRISRPNGDCWVSDALLNEIAVSSVE